MDEHMRGIYLLELKNQCESARLAGDHIRQALLAACHPPPGAMPGPNAEVFRALHSFLTHAGNISKLLWPLDKKSKERGKELRKFFFVTDANPLQERELRKHLEHFDERLDDWDQTSETRTFADFNIGPAAAYKIDGADHFRLYDPDTGRYTFRGVTYELRPIALMLKELDRRVTRALAGEDPYGEDPTAENIISRIPPHLVDNLLQSAPDPDSAEYDVMTGFLSVPNIGRVRVSAKRLKDDSGSYYWTPEKAVIVI
jgi:hypothetical protein